jgi:hypothetical protein
LTLTRREPRVAAAHVIEQPARRRHDQVGAASQGLRLRGQPHAAVHRRGAEPRVSAEIPDVLPHLHGQLARGAQDQDARVAAPLLQEPVQDRQQVRGRLPRPGLRRPDQVPARQDLRDHRLLDRRGADVSEIPHGLHQGFVKRKFFKSVHGPDYLIGEAARGHYRSSKSRPAGRKQTRSEAS